MSSSNCCFLTCIHISQEAGQVVWYSHLFQNSPQFIVIHTVEDFGVVNKAEIDVFLELSCFFDDQWMLAVWSLVRLPFLKPAWTSGSLQFTYCWSLTWRILIYIQQLYIHTYICNNYDIYIYIYIYTHIHTHIHTHSVHSGFLMLFLVLPWSYMNNSCKRNWQECAPRRAVWSQGPMPTWDSLALVVQSPLCGEDHKRNGRHTFIQSHLPAADISEHGGRSDL